MVKHKLPVLFKEIIAADAVIKDMRSDNVTDLRDWKDITKYRKGLSKAAAKATRPEKD